MTAVNIEQRKLIQRSIRWSTLGGVIVVSFVLYRAMDKWAFNAGLGVLLLVDLGIVAAVSTLGVILIVWKRPEQMRTVDATLWLRTSFWLYLPWLALAVAFTLVERLHSHQTLEMDPGDSRIAELWRGVSDLPCATGVIAPVAALILWGVRWRSLQKNAWPQQQRSFAVPFVAAVIGEIIIGASIIIDFGVFFIDV